MQSKKRNTWLESSNIKARFNLVIHATISVTGELFLHENEDAPHVIFVHGWRMDSNERVEKYFTTI